MPRPLAVAIAIALASLLHAPAVVHSQYRLGAEPPIDAIPHEVAATPGTLASLRSVLEGLDRDFAAATDLLRSQPDRRGEVRFELRVGEWDGDQPATEAARLGKDGQRLEVWSGSFTESPRRQLSSTRSSELFMHSPPTAPNPFLQFVALQDGDSAYFQFLGEANGNTIGTPRGALKRGASDAVHGIGGPSTGLILTMEWMRVHAAGLHRGLDTQAKAIVSPKEATVTDDESQRTYSFVFDYLTEEREPWYRTVQVLTLDRENSFLPVALMQKASFPDGRVLFEKSLTFEYADVTAPDGTTMRQLSRMVDYSQSPRHRRTAENRFEHDGTYWAQSERFVEARFDSVQFVEGFAEKDFKLDRQTASDLAKDRASIAEHLRLNGE